MSQATVIRKLQTLNVNMPYAKMLKKEFNIDLPEGTLAYQAEYMYKYAMQGLDQGIKQEDLYGYAEKRAEMLFNNMPWLTLKYEDLQVKTANGKVKTENSNEPRVKAQSVHAQYPDGTIVFCEKRNKHLLYVGHKIVVRCRTVEKVKEIALKKLNFTAFVE